MAAYDHKKIEKKWQERWEASQAFRAVEDTTREKNYLLIEFPYPSGEGLHVGHVRSWTALDVVARKRRAQGKNVLYPIGWDAFGLPAENYAIKTGIHPKIVTKQNTDNFRRQIKALGISFDWSREVNTTDPAYYKWTQWIFLQLYKNNLAYKAKIPVNWCPKDKIVLANEEVIDGACERCGTLVEKREKEQWMLAITKYAQRLYDDLDTVEYIERAKVQQKNWIGPSEGAEIDFEIADTKKKIKIFTTRPDTLFGATYMVLAPEHPWLAEELAKSQPGIENAEEVRAYITEAKQKSDIDRSAEGKEKTGVELKGVSAINPATKENIPLFVADYVLGNYGTGAIMAVPAHDERDGEFAAKFHIKSKDVLEPFYTQTTEPGKVREGEPYDHRDAIIAVVKHWKEEKYIALRWKEVAWGTFITGGIEKGQTAEEAAKMEIREETGFLTPELVTDYGLVHGLFYHVPKKVNRFAHARALVFKLKDNSQDAVAAEEAARHEVVWLTIEELKKFLTPDTHLHILRLMTGTQGPFTGEGILKDSGDFTGLTSEEAKKKITDAVGGTWVKTFKLRDWVFSRQRYWGEPIPMIYCEKDGWQPVPEDQLPVTLPEVEKYQPTDTGESPLAAMEAWVATTCPTCQGPARRETDVMPNWAGSSWYYLRYTDPANTKEFASQERLTHWTPVDWYNGGMEHTVLHLLYSRFWHKFLYDIKLVPTAEPYMKRTSHGLILAEGGEKMSKSKGNSVSPDTIVETYGADSLRLYEMFLGPFDQPVAWNTPAIIGVRRFLERVWKLEVGDTPASAAVETLLHQTIKKVTEDIENLKMNTVVSSLMILLNALEEQPSVSQDVYKIFLQLLAPLAPHLTSELWEKAGFESEVTVQPWPQFDASKILATTVPVAVQVNGKLRATIELSPTAGEEEALSAARADAQVQKWLVLGKEVKAVYVAGKIISFVIRQV